MDSSERPRGKMGRLSRVAVGICFLLCIGLLIPYSPLFEAAVSAYNEFVGSWYASEDSTSSIEARSKNVSVKDLTEMLAYANPAAKAFAAKALVYKQDRGAFPALIQALNDNRPFRDQSTCAETSLAELAKASLTELLKAQISREPEQIGLMLPLFTAAERGTPAERQAIVQILGEIREPLANGLLREAAADRDAELAATARASLGKIDSSAFGNEKSVELDARQMRVAAACALMIALLLGSVFSRLRQGLQANITILSVVPIILLGAFGALVLTDHFEGEISDQRIAHAVRSRDLVALRAMSYHDTATYPGDSQVAQFLLRTGNEEVLRCLIMLPSVQTTDSSSATEMTQTWRRWILGRFVAANLGTPRLAALLKAPDWETRASVAMALGKLGVRNDHVSEALNLLSQDSNERVKKSAEESMARVKSFPVWLGYAVPS